MDALVNHFQDNPVAYGVIGACLLPVFYLTRKWSGPVFFHCVEIVLYSAIFHLVFAGAVRFLSWFKEASKFRYWETDQGDTRLLTPLVNFWMKDQYQPIMLYYIEIAVFVIIVFVVIYFRPMSIGAKNRYAGADEARKKRMGRKSLSDRRKAAYSAGRSHSRARSS